MNGWISLFYSDNQGHTIQSTSGQVKVPSTCGDVWKLGHEMAGFYPVVLNDQLQYVYCDMSGNQLINPRGCSLKKNPRTPPKKFRKIRKKIQKVQGFFWGFNNRIPYLWMKNSLISVFKSFFIHKVKKTRKIQKIRKIPKNLEKSKKFFEDLKSVHPIWEWTTPRNNQFITTNNNIHRLHGVGCG